MKSSSDGTNSVFHFLPPVTRWGESGAGLRFMTHLYGLNKGTVSNYILHVTSCLYKVLQEDKFAPVECPVEEDRRSQEGSAYRFSKSKSFVDKTR